MRRSGLCAKASMWRSRRVTCRRTPYTNAVARPRSRGSMSDFASSSSASARLLYAPSRSTRRRTRTASARGLGGELMVRFGRWVYRDEGLGPSAMAGESYREAMAAASRPRTGSVELSTRSIARRSIRTIVSGRNCVAVGRPMFRRGRRGRLRRAPGDGRSGAARRGYRRREAANFTGSPGCEVHPGRRERPGGTTRGVDVCPCRLSNCRWR